MAIAWTYDLLYPTECKLCKKHIYQGELVVWPKKYSGVYHEICFGRYLLKTSNGREDQLKRLPSLFDRLFQRVL